MKKSDLITAALIAIIGTIAAYFLVDSIMGNPEEETVSFKYVANSLGSVAEPDSEVFNDSAINPTVDVYVGDGSCIDQNQDGELDIAEKIACGMASIEDINNAQSTTVVESEDDVDKALREINRQNILNQDSDTSDTEADVENTTNTSRTTNTSSNTSTTQNTSRTSTSTRTTTGE